MNYQQVQKILYYTILVGFLGSLVVLGYFVPLFLNEVMIINEVTKYSGITYTIYGTSCLLFYYSVYNIFIFSKNFTRENIFKDVNIIYLNRIHYCTLAFIAIYILFLTYMVVQNLMNPAMILIYSILFAGAAVVVSILKILRTMIQEGIDLSSMIEHTV